MKHCLKLTKIIAALSILSAVATVSLAGCTREGDSTLGYEFLPENQKLEMRHKSFKGGAVRSYDAAAGEYVESQNHRFFKTTLYRTDSIVSSNLQTGYIGLQRDKEGIFGLREAGFAAEFLFSSALEEDGFGYLPIFDSMRVLLSVTDFKGDSLRPIRYEVYEVINKSITESMEEANTDAVAYINHDMSGLYDASKLLFTFTFPDPDKGVYPSTTAVTMTPADLSENGATWDFIKRLMLVGDLDKGWDGYADDIAIYEDDDLWVEAFKGLYIKPVDTLADDEEGCMYATDLASTGIYLYGRNRNPEEPRLIKDTVHMGYVFYDANVTSAGNQSINYVKHDYTGSELETAMNVTDSKRETGDDYLLWREENRKNHHESATVYIEGMGGAATELYFTDDFLRELRNINAEEGFSHASINQALMYIYLDGSDYQWENIDPSKVTPDVLDNMLTRIGTYSTFETLTPIPDYNYYYESQYSTELNYDGYLSRSLGCYVMDISSYMQRLKNYVDTLNPDADDSFVYEGKFKASDSNAVSRTVVLGPEAYSIYTMQSARMQGMEDAANNAPIRIELTYTMIK